MAQYGLSLEQGKSSHETLDLVNGKKDIQRYHEIEVFEPGPEVAESGYKWKNCTKNPGHASFIPVSIFSPEHLPLRYRTPEVLDYLRALMTLTVKLRVTLTSYARPEGYPLFEKRGSDIPHCGSGWVCGVLIGRGPCPCTVCVGSSSPCQEWFEVYITTVCHVIYNSEEAQSTTLDIFYDDQESKKNGKVKTLSGLKVMVKFDDNDECVFTCVTHDRDLYEQLKSVVSKHEFTLPNPNVWTALHLQESMWLWLFPTLMASQNKSQWDIWLSSETVEGVLIHCVLLGRMAGHVCTEQTPVTAVVGLLYMSWDIHRVAMVQYRTVGF